MEVRAQTGSTGDVLELENTRYRIQLARVCEKNMVNIDKLLQ